MMLHDCKAKIIHTEIAYPLGFPEFFNIPILAEVLFGKASRNDFAVVVQDKFPTNNTLLLPHAAKK